MGFLSLNCTLHMTLTTQKLNILAKDYENNDQYVAIEDQTL